MVTRQRQIENLGKFGLFLDEQLLQYHLGNSHPMNSNRIFPAFTLLSELFIDLESEQFELVLPSSFDKEILFKAHTQKYVAAMERLSLSGKGTALEHGLGTSDCPVWKGMADASEFIVSSTVNLARKIQSTELMHGFIAMGGLHHAKEAQASGFCYYNDINVAIHALKQNQPEVRILYLDTDLHHGDGTQHGFYNDPNVLTISFHESGSYLFPGTGFSHEIGTGSGVGKSINLPFMPYTWDEHYLKQAESIIPSLFESFKPDIVVWQSGVDGHKLDPLGHLELTTNTYYKLGNMVGRLAEQVMDTPKVLTLGGGGYNPDSVARSWANVIAGLSNTKIPTKASDDWKLLCESKGIQVTQNLQDAFYSPDERHISEVIFGNERYKNEFESIVSKHFSV